MEKRRRGSLPVLSILFYLFSILFSLLCLPLAFAIAVFIRLETEGPVFYVQKRFGYRGRLFSLYKFRTMYIDSHMILEEFLKDDEKGLKEWETYNKLLTYDPRLTRVGRFLSEYSLDELPQILNILLGHMQLIGPRPYLPAEREQMGSYQEIILTVKPGLTGLWQVSGRNHIDFQKRLEMEAWYVENQSLGLDVQILIKTPLAVLKGDGL